eukprot:CAMPEP_0113256376 /NCGR_PEP_ID=MMETSP0008_2-20120614/14731_1 /TAXON_ID=97485 /ORGANISM="Prymnesium parvum" /LENGTH=432 /DNA_ID=CAMNT_0000104715 /DNA_START=1 /DNA_END=1299 /DNA_ORIENTATION=+ /assembly_acc=CAM_ASM_000153
MDEPFHAGQAQAYCAANWSQWDEKLTTFPGLHAAAASLAPALPGGRGPPHCPLHSLRAVNLLPALAAPLLLLRLLRVLHPDAPPADALANALVLALLPPHFFFHFLFYTDSAATASVLLLYLLSLPHRGASTGVRRLGDSVGVTLAGWMAVAFRQTNAVWLLFSMIYASLADLESHPGSQLRRRDRKLIPAVIALLRELPAHVPALLAAHAGPLLTLCLFAAFVIHNGGVVLGDKSNHAPVAHGAQLLYLSVVAAAPFEIGRLATDLPRLLGKSLRNAMRSPLLSLLMAALASCAAWLTYDHPFLLADNRHVTFYVWRHVLARHWAIRYLLVPGYLFLGSLIYPAVWKAQGALRACLLFGCCALVLVPTPLLEPRYFTLPVLLLRLHAPPMIGPRAWAPPLVLFTLVNIFMFALFLGRPYTWVDGSVARFMW